MKTLIIGSDGNQGRRYGKILDYLKEDWVGVDINTPEDPGEFDRVIICAPTHLHYDYCKQFIEMGKPFLCEKPISRDIERVEELAKLCKEKNVDGRMVCNWKYAIELALVRYNHPRSELPDLIHQGNQGDIAVMGEMDIYYDCWNTGGDGLGWDCIQLIYLGNENITLKNESPLFTCYVNEKHEITREIIEESFVVMLSNWINVPDALWSMDHAVKATKKVIEWEAKNAT